jgi:hypothetical protein
MSSATSTEGAASGARPWHFFVLAALMAAMAAVFLARGTTPPNVILLIIGMGAAALTALAAYRTVWPLVAEEWTEKTEIVAGRTRAALEREKMLVLRSIKELEFDRAMGKVSDADFQEMSGRLRARAVGLIAQLDEGGGYRALIERELEQRLQALGVPAIGAGQPAAADASANPATLDATDETLGDSATGSRDFAVRFCAQCGAPADEDAKFCKHCGTRL